MYDMKKLENTDFYVNNFVLVLLSIPSYLSLCIYLYLCFVKKDLTNSRNFLVSAFFLTPFSFFLPTTSTLRTLTYLLTAKLS